MTGSSTTSTYETLDYSVDDGVLTLTLDRPDHLNAFTVTMANELIAAYDRAGQDDEVAAIVVTGRGRAFCAGMDLSVDGNVFGLDESLRPTMADMHDRLADPEILHGVRDTGGRVTLAMYRCPKPIIGAINGAAVGIGATMTLPMDVRLASTTARSVGWPVRPPPPCRTETRIGSPARASRCSARPTADTAWRPPARNGPGACSPSARRSTPSVRSIRRGPPPRPS